jgi:hypothetical protein
MKTQSFREQLNRSVASERRAENFGFLFFWVVALATVAIYFWRCRFGVDMTDEPFYLVPAWKMYALGDRPFVDEIFNGMRHSDLLNFLFVRPLIPYSVLMIREAAVLFYALILAGFTALCFRGKLGMTAALTFAGCLIYDYFLIPTWSYNWWARDFLLIHHTLWLLAFAQRENPRSVWLVRLAGVAMGVAVVAYNSLLPALPLTAAALCLFEWRWDPHSKFLRRSVVAYLSAGLFVVAIDLAFVLSPSVKTDWLISVRSMSAMTEYSRHYALDKFFNVARYVLTRYEAGVLLLLFAAGYADGDWMAFLGRWREPWIQRERLRYGVVAACLTFLVWNFRHVSEPMAALSAIVSLGITGAVFLFSQAWRDRDALRAGLVVSALLMAFGIALSSTNQYLALFWALPAIIVPFAAAQTDQALLRLRPFSLKACLREGGCHAGLLLFLGFFALSAGQYQRLNTYYDVPPGNCETELNVVPLQGLRTSPRRAFLVETIAKLVGDREFILSFAETPGPLYFGQARSAVDTTMVEQGAPFETNGRSIQRMAMRDRLPTLAIKSHVRPWYWGIHHPLSHQPLAYPDHDPYSAFLNCARGKKLANYEEFSAYEIAPAKAAACVKLVGAQKLARTP